MNSEKQTKLLLKYKAVWMTLKIWTKVLFILLVLS